MSYRVPRNTARICIHVYIAIDADDPESTMMFMYIICLAEVMHARALCNTFASARREILTKCDSYYGSIDSGERPFSDNPL